MSEGIQNVIQPPAPKVKAKAKRKPRSVKGAQRPRSTPQTPEQKAETPLMTSVQRRDAAHANTARPQRIPIAARYEKLGSIAKLYEREGFHLRMHRNDPGRLAQALSAYYVFVTDEQGNNVTYQKGLRTMHLMEIPNELWEEEKALLKSKRRNTIEEKQQIGPDQYVPEGKSKPLTIDQTDD